ncbi:pyrroloquinoline quinone biosynthesis peptide chaperone PqqD [Herbaspirillum sp. SJZ107]|uniref:pyrroloquinoline quinone biosynthesis peptide chaperone PqqD n=1 Tax=Herbaspirillum sp. SJZ107 TaxID=2572881 RepID=UPI00115235A5|nr:pyrroloquinoline quinone biosynthesis peptide chaperone PqqD [Herbaspirillum sp. SJZ107]TQK07341.1 pyrroloquinoline quinone biosynthesis protein D [Herbaspirillum sp. SJZ107]
MSTASTPATPAIPATPSINRRFRLQWEPAQDSHVLLYPEGMVKLNASAGEILACCDGVRSVDEIVTMLEAKFQTQGLRGDIEHFLAYASQQGWVV